MTQCECFFDSHLANFCAVCNRIAIKCVKCETVRQVSVLKDTIVLKCDILFNGRTLLKWTRTSSSSFRTISTRIKNTATCAHTLISRPIKETNVFGILLANFWGNREKLHNSILADFFCLQEKGFSFSLPIVFFTTKQYCVKNFN